MSVDADGRARATGADASGASDDDALERGLEQLRGLSETLVKDVYADFQTLAWFRALDAETRAWIRMLLQQQIRVLLEELGYGDRGRPELSFISERPGPGVRISLEQATDLLGRACGLLVERCESLVDPTYRLVIRTAAEAFLRKTAFEVAGIYARSAARHGADDAGRETRLIGALADALPPATIASRAFGLLALDEPLLAFGILPRERPDHSLAQLHQRARTHSIRLIADTRGGVILGLVRCHEHDELERVLTADDVRAAVIDPTPRPLPELTTAMNKVQHTLRAAPAHHGPTHILEVDQLLAQRALTGDQAAHEQLVTLCITPLLKAGVDLLETVQAVIDADGVLEAAARALPAHTNTVRYRLARVDQLTGRDPQRFRDALDFQIALVRHRTSLG